MRDMESFEAAKEILYNTPPDLPIVLLGNFRDVLGTEEEHRAVPMREVEKLAQRCNKKSGEERVHVFEASMANCYGLKVLYNYLNVPYLTHKINVLEEQLAATRRELQTSFVEVNEYATALNYSDFVMVQNLPGRQVPTIVSPGAVITPPQSERSAKQEVVSPQSVTRNAPVDEKQKDRSRDKAKSKKSNKKQNRVGKGIDSDDEVSGLVSAVKPAAVIKDVDDFEIAQDKSALAAFLDDSDEDDGYLVTRNHILSAVQKAPTKPTHATSAFGSSSDSEDSEYSPPKPKTAKKTSKKKTQPKKRSKTRTIASDSESSAKESSSEDEEVLLVKPVQVVSPTSTDARIPSISSVKVQEPKPAALGLDDFFPSEMNASIPANLGAFLDDSDSSDEEAGIHNDIPSVSQSKTAQIVEIESEDSEKEFSVPRASTTEPRVEKAPSAPSSPSPSHSATISPTTPPSPRGTMVVPLSPSTAPSVSSIPSPSDNESDDIAPPVGGGLPNGFLDSDSESEEGALTSARVETDYKENSPKTSAAPNPLSDFDVGSFVPPTASNVLGSFLDDDDDDDDDGNNNGTTGFGPGPTDDVDSSDDNIPSVLRDHDSTPSATSKPLAPGIAPEKPSGMSDAALAAIKMAMELAAVQAPPDLPVDEEEEMFSLQSDEKSSRPKKKKDKEKKEKKEKKKKSKV